jgi:type III secretion system (T3SS) SseB-like protein
MPEEPELTPADVPLPQITREMRASARANPNTWLYVIDPAFEADADVPPWGVVGAYPVDEHGEISGTFSRNTEYRPSPTALRMPKPASELERVLQLVKTGHREPADLLPAVLAANLLVYASGEGDRELTGFPTKDGGGVAVPACTSVARIPSAWPGWRELPGRLLATQLHDHPLVINPEGPITALIPAADLARANSASA